MPGRVSRLMPAIPYQALRRGSKLKKTSCSSHFPERDSSRTGGVTRNTTGVPLTSRNGCQRTDHNLKTLLFGAGGVVWPIATGIATKSATASKKARFLREGDSRSRNDLLSTKTSLALLSRHGSHNPRRANLVLHHRDRGHDSWLSRGGPSYSGRCQGGPRRGRQEGTHSHFDEPGEDFEDLQDRAGRRAGRPENPAGRSHRLRSSLRVGMWESELWWTWSGSNRRPLPCHGSALPAAPQAHLVERRNFPQLIFTHWKAIVKPNSRRPPSIPFGAFC